MAYYVAAANSSAIDKTHANLVCSGSSGNRIDHTSIQTAYNTLLSGEELHMLPGTYYFGGMLSLGTEQTVLRMSAGARINFTTVTGLNPLVRVTNSNIRVYGGRFQGSGRKGNGIGIQIGDPTQGQPNGVVVYDPRFEDLYAGIEFGIQTSGGTESTGDCKVQ